MINFKERRDFGRVWLETVQIVASDGKDRVREA